MNFEKIFQIGMIAALYCLGIGFAYMAIIGEPVLYDQLNFNEKICQHFNDCDASDIQLDFVQNPIITMFMVVIPIIDGILFWFAIGLHRGYVCDNKKEKVSL
jgi:hypothetical protein